MKINKLTALAMLSGCLLGSTQAFATLFVNSPVDVIGNLSALDFTNNGYGTHSYKDWGNEPFVAVNPVDTNDIWISSFNYNTSSTSSGASTFYSTNGGASWSSEFAVPAPSNGVRIPNDWNFAYDSTGTLHGAVLGGCGTCNVYAGQTTNPTSLSAWSYAGGGSRINALGSANHADQPWIAVHAANDVFVAYDNFNGGTTPQLAGSTNGGANFTINSTISNGAQTNNYVNPGTRIATDGNGTIYSIYGLGAAPTSQGVHFVTYYLNRSTDGGATWDFAANSTAGGIAIASGLSSQLDNAGTQTSNNWFARVNDLRGNIDAIAADQTASHIYVMYGVQDGSGTDRIYLEEFHPVGTTLVGSTPVVVSPAGQRAALPSLTVLANGTVVMMYETYDATDGKVHVYVADSADFGASISSYNDVYDFTPLSLLAATGSASSNREFGDYLYMTSLNDTFYGTFAGLGDVNGGGIDTTGLIDPFLFTGSVSIPVPEPGSLALLGAGLAMFWLTWACRRRRSRRA